MKIIVQCTERRPCCKLVLAFLRNYYIQFSGYTLHADCWCRNSKWFKFFDFVGILNQNVLFHIWPSKLLPRSHIFKVKVSKASSGRNAENLELSHVQIGHYGLGCRSLKKSMYSSSALLIHTWSLLYSATAEYWLIVSCHL
jgi:hypothetical protein